MNEIEVITEKFAPVFEGEYVEAAGKPGEAGNPKKLTNVAEKIIEIYRSMYVWAFQLNSVYVHKKLEAVVLEVKKIILTPLADIETFLEDVDKQVRQISEGKSSNLNFHLTFSELNLQRFNEEINKASQGVSDIASEIQSDTDRINNLIKKADTFIQKNNTPKNEQINPIIKPIELISVPYPYPPSSLLAAPQNSHENQAGESEKLKNNAERLILALENFGVKATLTDIFQGPTITRYEIMPNAGTKMSAITNLNDDIALCLGTENVRIAPVPGKVNVVGIGVPSQFSTVYIRDLIESSEFISANDPATIIIGRGIEGQNIVANLPDLSHLLIAGSDSSGKTVFLDAIITSMLYKASPKQLRFLMIDAKMIDLNIFNGIPHLLCPIVTNEKRAVEALEWVAAEINKRCNLLGQCDIESYNEKISKEPDGELMPRIIVIVDHIAMLVGIHNELKGVVARIAKKAHICGVHLILSTQQPEAEVVKDIINAINPSRIAFRIDWKKGSQVILGTDDAKKLTGRGDMLYLPIGTETPFRVQGCYMTETEITKVVEYIK
jgi:DNA segregation ATPase FtsK/SpoIIIE-like protein